MLDTAPMTTETAQPRTLKASDRCDRCGGQAYVRVSLSLSLPDLLFCGHHFAANEVKIVSLALLVTDERAALLAR